MTVDPGKIALQPAYAIVRVDEFQTSEVEWRNRIKVVRVVWDQALAQREVERLQRQAVEGAVYFWQTTKCQSSSNSA